MNWKIPAQAAKAAAILEAHGEKVFLVGGAVRDLLLQKKPKDWDLVTSAPLEKLQQLFARNFFLGKKKETINVFLDDFLLEISPYRLGSTTLEEDLGKRDFTINALAYDCKEKILIDPFAGKKDLENGLLRAVGNPNQRLQEDPLRMLRALRFLAQYDFHLAPTLLEAITKNAPLLGQVALERIRDELARILLTNRITPAISLAERLGLLPLFFPELSACFKVEQNAFHNQDVAGHILKVTELLPADNLELRLVGLLHDLGKPQARSVGKDGRVHFYGHENYSAELAKTVLKRLKISGRLLDIPLSPEKILLLVKNHMFCYRQNTSDQAVRRLLFRIRPQNYQDFLLLQKADMLAGSPAKQEGLPDLKRLESTIEKILLPKPPLGELALTGQEIMAILQLKPGKKVGEIKKKLLQAVIDNPQLNNKESLISLLKKEKSTLS